MLSPSLAKNMICLVALKTFCVACKLLLANLQLHVPQQDEHLLSELLSYRKGANAAMHGAFGSG
jgi:hypothetical protein